MPLATQKYLQTSNISEDLMVYNVNNPFEGVKAEMQIGIKEYLEFLVTRKYEIISYTNIYIDFIASF